MQEAQRLVRDLADADLQGAAVLDETDDVAGHLARDLVRGRVLVLGQGLVGLDREVDVAPGERLGVRQRHAGVRLRRHQARLADQRGRDVDADAEAQAAVGIRARRLDQRDVGTQPTGGDQARHLRDRHRHVVDGAAAFEQRAHLAADEQRAVHERADERRVVVRQQAVGDEVEQRDVGERRGARVQRLQQHAGRRRGRRDEDDVAVAHPGHRLGGGHHPRRSHWQARRHPNSIPSVGATHLRAGCSAGLVVLADRSSTRGLRKATMSNTRIEHDLLGDREVPAEAYYGVHTLRAKENFQITGADDRVVPGAGDRAGFGQGGRGRGQHRARPARAGEARRDRRRLPGDSRRCAARSVRRRRDPGRRGDVDQHERERGDLQSRARDHGPRARRVPVPASERRRQHGAEHQRRLSDRAAHRILLRDRGAARGDGPSARRLRGEGQGVRGPDEDRPHPAAGRRADDAGPGVLDLRGDGRGRHPPVDRGVGADPRDQPGRDGHRHRHHRASGIRRHRAEVPASASPACRCRPRRT